MTLSYFESILHVVENATPGQLKPSYLRSLQKYGDHLVESCYMIDKDKFTENKNLILDYLRILNSLLRVKEAIKKCKRVYEETRSDNILVISSDGVRNFDELSREIKSLLLNIIPNFTNLGSRGYKSKVELTPCKLCGFLYYAHVHDFIKNFGDDEQSREIKELEKELTSNLFL